MLAEVLAVVDHPVVGYGTAPLGHRALWEGLLLAVEAEELLTGPGTEVRRRHRRTWPARTWARLTRTREPLDRLAINTGADAAHDAATVARRERAASRTAEIARARAVRAGLIDAGPPTRFRT